MFQSDVEFGVMTTRENLKRKRVLPEATTGSGSAASHRERIWGCVRSTVRTMYYALTMMVIVWSHPLIIILLQTGAGPKNHIPRAPIPSENIESNSGVEKQFIDRLRGKRTVLWFVCILEMPHFHRLGSRPSHLRRNLHEPTS